MEGIVFILALVISALAMIWLYIGPWAVVLLIAVVIFGGHMLFKSVEKSENEKYDSSEYVETALKFLEFYALLPPEMRHQYIILTPMYIGVRLSDDHLGIRIKIYLGPMSSLDPEFKEAARKSVHSDIERLFGGAKGLNLYKQLGLDVKLHNNDEDLPVVFMYHPTLNTQNLNKYAKAIERRYKEKYGESVNVVTWDEY